jgi:hypothetical protein
MSTLFTLTQHSLEIENSIREEEEIKGIQIGKEEIKVPYLQMI